MNRVIFLDMDGVLCSPRACIAVGNNTIFAYLDPISVKLLNRICEKSGALLVLSSTWKTRFPQRSAIEAILEAAGFLGRFHEVHCTPYIGSNRELEIDKWIEDNAEDDFEYIILDDEKGNLLPHQLDRLVQTAMYDGILHANYFKALDLFGVS